MNGPLAGVTVVALEQAVSAPLCTRHLADLGARVIKVENPRGGDFTRDYDDVVHGMAAHFVWLNRGKESLALDVRSAQGIWCCISCSPGPMSWSPTWRREQPIGSGSAPMNSPHATRG